MTQAQKVKVGTRTPLARDIILVEGITRSGKFLLADLLAGLEGVEPVQYRALLEHVPFLERFGFIEKKSAEELLKFEVDMSVYESRIGRRLNYRKSDKSSVFNHPRYLEILKRPDVKDGEAALKVYYKEKPYSMFIVHETMPNMKIFFDVFKDIRILSLQRSPVQLVHSWWKRGLGKRWGHDPRLFQIPFESRQGPVPWFALDWKDDYHTLSEMDRIIKTISVLREKYAEGYARFSAEDKKKILFVRFEEMVMATEKSVRVFETFLKRVRLPEMTSILKREGLPNALYSDGTLPKLEEIKKHASSAFFKLLLKEEKSYFS